MSLNESIVLIFLEKDMWKQDRCLPKEAQSQRFDYCKALFSQLFLRIYECYNLIRQLQRTILKESVFKLDVLYYILLNVLQLILILKMSKDDNITGLWENHVFLGDDFWGIHYVFLTLQNHVVRGSWIYTLIDDTRVACNHTGLGSFDGTELALKVITPGTSYTSQIKLKMAPYGMEGTWTDSLNQKGKIKMFKRK